MTNLKPCPFCGSQPRFYPEQLMRNGDCYESLECGNDDCVVRPATDYAPIAEAIAAWNTRPAPKVSADDIAQIVYDAWLFCPARDVPVKPSWEDADDTTIKDRVRKCAARILAALGKDLN